MAETPQSDGNVAAMPPSGPSSDVMTTRSSELSFDSVNNRKMLLVRVLYGSYLPAEFERDLPFVQVPLSRLLCRVKGGDVYGLRKDWAHHGLLLPVWGAVLDFYRMWQVSTAAADSEFFALFPSNHPDDLVMLEPSIGFSTMEEPTACMSNRAFREWLEAFRASDSTIMRFNVRFLSSMGPRIARDLDSSASLRHHLNMMDMRDRDVDVTELVDNMDEPLERGIAAALDSPRKTILKPSPEVVANRKPVVTPQVETVLSSVDDESSRRHRDDSDSSLGLGSPGVDRNGYDDFGDDYDPARSSHYARRSTSTDNVAEACYRPKSTSRPPSRKPSALYNEHGSSRYDGADEPNGGSERFYQSELEALKRKWFPSGDDVRRRSDNGGYPARGRGRDERSG